MAKELLLVTVGTPPREGHYHLGNERAHSGIEAKEEETQGNTLVVEQNRVQYSGGKMSFFTKAVKMHFCPQAFDRKSRIHE